MAEKGIPSSSFRFIHLSDQTNRSPNPTVHFEMDESDVLWPSDGGGESPVSVRSAAGESLRRPSFPPGKFGLSAALAEDGRRSAINVPGRSGTAGISKMFHQSAPVNVPAWPRGMRKPAGDSPEAEEEAEEDEMLPPHLIVAKSRVMTFSVFEGVGRTLKGRDLRRVRNAVFQKTGFLE